MIIVIHDLAIKAIEAFIHIDPTTRIYRTYWANCFATCAGVPALHLDDAAALDRDIDLVGGGASSDVIGQGSDAEVASGGNVDVIVVKGLVSAEAAQVGAVRVDPVGPRLAYRCQESFRRLLDFDSD